ncbi:MAG: sigma-54-dependent transcriptional regulator [Candidatus Rokuibacteriota bacterium]
MKPRILIVDNDAEMVALLTSHLRKEDVEAVGATSGTAATALLDRERFAVVFADLVMDDVDGLDVLRRAQQLQPDARVILMTAFGSLGSAIEAIRAGVFDYLTKPFKMADVTLALHRALEHHRLKAENRRLRAEVGQRFGHVLYGSRVMRAVLDEIEQVAESDATVLLLGESGSGKEVVARAIHWRSRRQHGPFIPVNCAAIPEHLLESELFGHEKGAFTGASQSRRGLFAEAEGGTLFLDEIVDMPPPLQAKLLRVLQERTVRPIGGREEIRIDVRVLSATNRDPAAAVRDKKFRDDLYYRLAVIPIRIPSLRERPEDIPVLAAWFLERAAASVGKRFEGFTDEAMAWLQRQRWPGNVRELENMVERAVVLARDTIIEVGDLRSGLVSPASPDLGVQPTLVEVENEYIRRVLTQTGGDKVAAARVLGVSVRTLQRRFPPWDEPVPYASP